MDDFTLRARALDVARERDIERDIIAFHSASRVEVIARIERLARDFITCALTATSTSEFPPPVWRLRGSRRDEIVWNARDGYVVARRRSTRAEGDEGDEGTNKDDVDGNDVDNDDASDVAAGAVRFRESDRGASYARFWTILDVVRGGLLRECGLSIRELYYVMVSRGMSERIVMSRDRERAIAIGETITDGKLADTIRNISAALGVPRCALGISATSKGQVFGRVHVETAMGARHDCTITGSGGFAITGNMLELDAMRIHSDCAYVIVVEKDAVFQRLLNERIFDTIPCVVITAKGFPDLATRKFLALLRDALEYNPIVARFYMLADFNPSGLWIWATYSSGSGSSFMDSVPYAVPLQLIGLRAEDLHLVPENAFQTLTPRDEALIENALSAGDSVPLCAHRRELETMRARRQKAEIEALYANDPDFSLTAFISTKIAMDEAERSVF